MITKKLYIVIHTNQHEPHADALGAFDTLEDAIAAAKAREAFGDQSPDSVRMDFHNRYQENGHQVWSDFVSFDTYSIHEIIIHISA